MNDQFLGLLTNQSIENMLFFFFSNVYINLFRKIQVNQSDDTHCSRLCRVVCVRDCPGYKICAVLGVSTLVHGVRCKNCIVGGFFELLK